MKFKHGTDNNNYSEAVTEIPVIEELFDNTPNNNDKSFVVPNNELWHINFVQATLTTSTTVGNRLLAFTVTNADSELMLTLTAAANQAASLTRRYTGLQGQFRETSFVNNEIHQPLPKDLYLKPGTTVRIFDTANIDSNDTMVIASQHKVYVGAG